MPFTPPFFRRRRHPTQIPILAYHALNAPGKDYASNDHVALEEDLGLIRRLGFKVAPLAKIAELTWTHAASRLDSGQWVGLSFDDGTDFDYLDIDAHPYLGHVKSFYTILKESGAAGGRDWPQPTGTAFVIASPEARAVLDKTCIAGLNQWRDVWWAEAAQTGILEIGNHSWDHTHPTLDTVAQREQRKGTFKGIDNLADADTQIIQADKYIQQLTNGHAARLFAYPYGETTDYLIEEYFPKHMPRHRNAEYGGLLSYGNDQRDQFRLAATYVDRVLNGAKLSELPLEAPVKFELVINLKTAKALKLTIPGEVQPYENRTLNVRRNRPVPACRGRSVPWYKFIFS